MIYPQLLPVEAVNTFIQAAINRQNLNVPKLVGAGYQLLGYILGQTVGEPAAMTTGLSHDQQVDALADSIKELLAKK